MSLPEEFRARAEEQREAARVFLNSLDLNTNATSQITAILGNVNASMLEYLAEAVEYLEGKRLYSSVNVTRRKILERNNDMRHAAVRGDWGRFDELVAEWSAAASIDKAGGTPEAGDDVGD